MGCDSLQHGKNGKEANGNWSLRNMSKTSSITVDAAALQERDEFRPEGWVKAISPAKVNLHLAIGERRPDGYHSAATIMHALNLHDIVYMRRSLEPEAKCTIVPLGDIELPPIPLQENLAFKAITKLAEALSLPANATQVDIRIEKNIPAQAGLGGGSSNAAAALLGFAALSGIDTKDPAIEAVARSLGADCAFFLHGGCSYLEGTGDTFVHDLAPSKRCVALVKPDGGVSTAEAYRRFDNQPEYATAELAQQVSCAQSADDVALFNNLAPAAESLMPELATVRSWLADRPETDDALLCGSGATTFAPCRDFNGACEVVAAAREHGWWARVTSFSSIRAAVLSGAAAGGAL